VVLGGHEKMTEPVSFEGPVDHPQRVTRRAAEMSPMKTRSNTTHMPSLVASLLVMLCALTDILDQAMTEWRPDALGPDSVSLMAGVICLLCLSFERDRVFLKIVTLGLLFYVTYMYGCYCFSVIASNLYVLYMVIFALSLFTFTSRLFALSNSSADIGTNSRYPRRIIACFFILTALMMLKGELPHVIELTIEKHKSLPSSEAYIVLDLCVLFPALVLAGFMSLWKRHPSVILTGVLLIELAALMTAILMTDIYKYVLSGSMGNTPFDVIASIITMISLALLHFYKRGMAAPV
jgi:hypothetical protein